MSEPNYVRPENIVVGVKAPRCPESWWATPGQTRSEFYAKWQARVEVMKQTRQAGYGRADGVDAQ